MARKHDHASFTALNTQRYPSDTASHASRRLHQRVVTRARCRNSSDAYGTSTTRLGRTAAIKPTGAGALSLQK